MVDFEKIIEAADELAVSEIKKYDIKPHMYLYDLANQKGTELAEKYRADKSIVQIGTRLMNLKLGEAMSMKKPELHTELSIAAAKEFLAGFDLDQQTKDKLINCIEGHLGETEWKSKEAEICANSNCYKFLQVRSWMAFFNALGLRDTSFDEDLSYAESKADERWKILSLDIAKQELEPQYKLIKEIVKQAKRW